MYPSFPCLQAASVGAGLSIALNTQPTPKQHSRTMVLWCATLMGNFFLHFLVARKWRTIWPFWSQIMRWKRCLKFQKFPKGKKRRWCKKLLRLLLTGTLRTRLLECPLIPLQQIQEGKMGHVFCLRRSWISNFFGLLASTTFWKLFAKMFSKQFSLRRLAWTFCSSKDSANNGRTLAKLSINRALMTAKVEIWT